MTRARPLRFLALVICAWAGGRALILNMPVPQPGAGSASAAALPAMTATVAPHAVSPPTPSPSRVLASSLVRDTPHKGAKDRVPAPGLPPAVAAAWSASSLPPAAAGPRRLPPERPAAAAPPGWRSLVAERSGRSRRWSGAAWLLLRDDLGAAALAPGGTLGGSQAGARLTYRIGSGLALSGRAYLPVRRTAEAEAAVGLDWQPSARLPLHLLAERRQDVGGAGRSAFALTLYGGAAGQLPGGLRAELYAQAGVAGVRSGDLFVDGALRVALPVGPVELGGGVRGAAQPGAARLDAGPAVAYRLPVRGANLRLEAGWRFRIAGDAAPGSGPALSLAADF